MALTLAIDLGTTNLKVGLVNEQGAILSLCSSGVPTVSNEAGAAEHDPEQLKDLVISLCAKEAAHRHNPAYGYPFPNRFF